MKKRPFFNRTTLIVVGAIIVALLLWFIIRPQLVGCVSLQTISDMDSIGEWTAPTGPIIQKEELLYLRSDIEFLEGQGARSLQRVVIEYQCGDSGDFTIGIVGINAAGGIMNGPSDHVALPCPPYCKDNGELTFIAAKSIVESH